MILTVERRYRKADYTVGWLYIDGRQICNTLEDTDRGLIQDDSPDSVRRRKVYGRTAIPVGSYNVRMDVVSPKYSGKGYYVKLCGARMPRIEDVTGFEGVLIHPGNTVEDTLGCILVGDNTKRGELTGSRARFEQIYKMMSAAYNRGEKITLKIV